MPNNHFTETSLRIFSDEALRRLHAATLRLLETVGVVVESEEALNLLADYGVRCDISRKRAYPDSATLDRALKTVGREYRVYHRGPDGLVPLRIGLDTVHLVSGAATEARAGDAQAAGERFLSLGSCIMAGASLVQGTTAEMSGLELAEYRQCVIDDEIAGYLLEFAAGPDMEELDEAMQAITDVADEFDPSGCYFLEHPHTVRLCARKPPAAGLFAQGKWSDPHTEAHRDLAERAEARVRTLLQDPEDILPADLQTELHRIAEEDDA